MGEPSAASAARMNQQSSFSRNQFGSVGSSSPTTTFRTDIFAVPFGSQGSQFHTAQYQNNQDTAAYAHRPSLASSVTDPSSYYEGRTTSSVVIRKLSSNTTQEALASMLIFSNDFIDVYFAHSAKPEDQGYKSAVARFRTPGGAHEAVTVLNGKPNAVKDANMIVEIQIPFERRNTVDGSRSQTSSASSSGSVNGGRSRFNSTFQSTDRTSPPSGHINGVNGELPAPETSPRFQQLFSSPTSQIMSFTPTSSHFLSNGSNHRISGKSTINDDSADDETGELLRDPVAFAQGNHQPRNRRGTTSQINTRFGSLSLSTTNGDGHSNDLDSPTSNGMQTNRTSHQMSIMSPTGRFVRAFPPINPADQNAPCNTLYVGNLPVDTTEDELKGIFSKCRGYKRLCFRTKTNGPMCFVEFEDVAYATKTLYALYGIVLHGSANSKGGIRLSYSKNPLGVRGPPQQQPNGVGGPNSPKAVMPPPPGYGPMANNGYSSVSGPPPGLGNSASAGRGIVQNQQQPRGPPPGMDGAAHMTNGHHSFGGYGMATGPGMATPVSPRTMPATGFGAGGPITNGFGRGHTNYSPHMLGR